MDRPKRGSFRKLNHLRQLDSRKQPLIVHAEEAWFHHILEGANLFFEKIGAAASSHGFKPLLLHAEDILSYGLLPSDHLQIVIGPKRPQGSRIFHAQPGYLRGFWYLDPKGYYWNSSLAGEAFRPDPADAAAAERFLESLRNRYIGRNTSKRAQNPRSDEPLPPAAAAIFVQNIEGYKPPVHYLTTEEMITAACDAAPGRVYVKLHPLQDSAARQKVEAHCASLANAELSAASVHDLIAASDTVISQNSAVGFEALMQKKPVITCGRSDYHHATAVCRSAEDLHKALADAAGDFRSFPYAQYLHWFLRRHLLEPGTEDFAAQAWSRLLSPPPGGAV